VSKADDETREQLARLIDDSDLFTLRVSACESVAQAVGVGASYLHVPAALGNDRKVKALSLVMDMAFNLTQSSTTLFRAERWYSGTALVRQVIETEYLLALFGRDLRTAEQWLDASEKELRKWWAPAAMRKRLQGEFDEREYWDHCNRGGHPVPRAEPLLDGPLNKLDRRFCWIDFAMHCKRVFRVSVNCYQAFGYTKFLEQATEYAIAYSAIEAWSNRDPAPSILQAIPRV
jgi:hypothetical protein